MNNYAIIIPALNPTESLIEYVTQLIEKGLKRIIVVNDGSKVELTYIFSQLMKLDGCVVLTHEINQGKGRALKTAFTYVLQHCKDLNGVVTADADGQHSIQDVCMVVNTLIDNPQKLILGTRDFSQSNIPTRSLIGNKITSFIFRLLYGTELEDTQTGLRGISFGDIPWMIGLKGERYEYEINMLIRAKKNNVDYYKVPIQTLYFENNSGSNYQPIRDSLKVFIKLITGFLHYSLSTITSGLIDIICFILLTSFFFAAFPLAVRIFLSTFVARIISSVFNFYMNRQFVFRGKNPIVQSVFKYYLLCAGLILASYSMVLFANGYLHLNLVISKICIDTFLGILSYQFQLHWVFKVKKLVGDQS